jgi:prophage regulatory protein
VKVLRRPATRAKTGLSDGTIDLKEARGEFPKRVRLGSRAIGWIEEEIDKWIAERAAERTGEAANG